MYPAASSAILSGGKFFGLSDAGMAFPDFRARAAIVDCGTDLLITIHKTEYKVIRNFA